LKGCSENEECGAGSAECGVYKKEFKKIIRKIRNLIKFKSKLKEFLNT